MHASQIESRFSSVAAFSLVLLSAEFTVNWPCARLKSNFLTVTLQRDFRHFYFWRREGMETSGRGRPADERDGESLF